jgi:hypothetical protein
MSNTTDLLFAADLNRTSVKKMNKKNINKTNETITKNSSKNIRNKSIDEFIYMGEIMNGKNLELVNNLNVNETIPNKKNTKITKIKTEKLPKPEKQKIKNI